MFVNYIVTLLRLNFELRVYINLSVIISTIFQVTAEHRELYTTCTAAIYFPSYYIIYYQRLNAVVSCFVVYVDPLDVYFYFSSLSSNYDICSFLKLFYFLYAKEKKPKCSCIDLK